MRCDEYSTAERVAQEELVVTKRLVLKEEIHLIKQQSLVRSPLLERNRERAGIHRLDAEGRIVVQPAGRRRGLLE